MAVPGGSIAAPTSMAEVEQLVMRFFQPGNPTVIAAIDDQLKRLQHSPEGWQLADALLGSQDTNVRFFAALTFQVKLNNDGSSLDAATAQSVLMRLLYWLVTQLNRAGEGHLVQKKLCACLTTYFLRASTPWDRPLLHLAASLQQGDAIPVEQAPAGSMSEILASLGHSQLVTLLWFAASLAIDAAKVDNVSPTSAQIHKQMETMVEDTARILRATLKQSADVKAESLSCFLNWVNYAQPMWTHNQEALDHLRSLVPDFAALLKESEMQNEAMDVFRDILEGYTTFFGTRHMELLANVIHQNLRPRLLQSLQDREPEVIPVAQLVIAFGIANIQQVVEQPDHDVGSKNIVDLLLAILESPGHPGDDDEVSIHSIEFWNTYIEYVNDVMYSRDTGEPLPVWLDHDKQVCLRLSALLWSKMRTPTPETAEDWSDAESEAFKEFRMDASDLMMSIFVRLGNEMLQQFIKLCLDSLAAKNWQDLEAALFCINSLSDNVMEDPSAEQMLVHIFSSSLFREIADYSQPIPKQARRTAIDTLGTYGAYIERHSEFLPDTLRFLFASLETFGFHLSAAKSIDELCSTCRTSLTGELEGFLAQYHRFTLSQTSEPYTNERVIGAIAAVIQAVTPESSKARPLTALLDIVDNMVAHSKQLAAQGDMTRAHEVGVSAVDCLVRIGKGMQAPEDVPVNIYDEDDEPNSTNFWETPDGQSIQTRILTTCYTVIQLFSASGEVIESVCGVLKAGLAEQEPGPFVFSTDMTIGFFEQCSASTPRLELVLSLVCTLLRQQNTKDLVRLFSIGDRIYKKTVTIIQILVEPSADTAVAQACIDVLTWLVGRYSNVLLDINGSGELVLPVLDFTIKAIDNPDLMPKRQAAEFWAKMIKAPTQPQSDNAVRTRTEQVIAAYGQPLTQALINQITGRGQRSELDGLCEPLRALVVNQPNTKVWLESALTNEGLPNIAGLKVDVAGKRKFVQQCLGVRGDVRRLREVVRTFYAVCRGTVARYGS